MENYCEIKDFCGELVSFLDHGFMIMQPRSQQKTNIRIQRQKGCLYVCGVKFETPIDEMRTSLNAGDNIICPHEVAVPRELDGGHSLVKIIIPAKLKNAIMNGQRFRIMGKIASRFAVKYFVINAQCLKQFGQIGRASCRERV